MRSNIKQKWVVSYDNVPEISALYTGCRQQTFGLHYSAMNRYQGTEIMVFCDGLITPELIKPSRARAA